MATTIKIHVADGQDNDAEIDLTPEQAAAVAHFLSRVSYMDVYRNVPHAGDGNALGSQSDRETRTARDAIRCLRSAFDSALRRDGHFR